MRSISPFSVRMREYTDHKIPNTDTFHIENNTSISSEMGNISYKGNVSSVVKFSYI